MTPEEITAQNALLDKVKLEAKSILEKGEEATKKELKALADSVKALEAKQIPDHKAEIEKLNKQIEEIGLGVKSLQESGKEVKAKSISSAFIAAYKSLMFDKDGAFKPMLKGDQRNMEVKTAATMTTANISPVGTDSIPFTLAQYEVGLTRLVRRMPFILDLVNLGTTVKKFVQWAEQANADDGLAAMTGEGQGKHQTDFDIVEKSAEVKKISAYIKVSTEMLDDVDFMQSEIQTELIELLRLKLDQQVLLGTGTGVELNGIITQAQGFNPASPNFLDSIFNANQYDVLRVAINQVQVNQFQPNFIVMHPSDLTKMELEKSSTGEYVIYPFKDQVGGVVKGVPIITNTGMTEGRFLVGDFTKSRVLIRKDVAINIGWDGNDFTNNLVTILGELRAVHYIKTNYQPAFVYGVFSTAIADLNTTT